MLLFELSPLCFVVREVSLSDPWERANGRIQRDKPPEVERLVSEAARTVYSCAKISRVHQYVIIFVYSNPNLEQIYFLNF